MNNDDAARAQHLWESLKCDEDPVPILAAALDEARRDTWEAAAQIIREQAQLLTSSQSQEISRSGEEEAS